MTNTGKKIMLSENFSLEELTHSSIAVENAIDNTPGPEERHALKGLVTHLLEPLRLQYGGPIAILSGYRNKEVNRLAGGVVVSQHRKGEAADCYISEGPGYLLNLLIKSGLVFDQAILYKNKRFLHLSYKSSGTNRMQIILFLCVVCLFSGCRTRMEYTEASQDTYSDRMEWNGGDSLIQRDYSGRIDTFSWELERVAYLPPDSSGVQFIESITVAKAYKMSSNVDSSLLIAGNREEFRQESSRTLSVDATGQVASSSNYHLWLCCLVVTFLLVVRMVRKYPLSRNST